MKPQTFQELGKGSLIIPSVINLSKKNKKTSPPFYLSAIRSFIQVGQGRGCEGRKDNMTEGGKKVMPEPSGRKGRSGVARRVFNRSRMWQKMSAGLLRGASLVTRFSSGNVGPNVILMPNSQPHPGPAMIYISRLDSLLPLLLWKKKKAASYLATIWNSFPSESCAPPSSPCA